MKLLKIKVYTPICKTENGSVGTTSRMLKLDDYIENENKNKNVQARLIKGLKGWLRHKYSVYYKNKGVEVCYSSSKESYKDRKVELPKGYHFLGSCDGTCPIYQIFGGVIAKKEKSNALSKMSKIRVWANPIISKKRFNSQPKEIQEELKRKFNLVSFNVENGVALGENGESIQNFGKEFFSGEFDILIDVTKLNDEERSTLLEVLLSTSVPLGADKTYGKGIIEIKGILFQEISDKISLIDGKIKREEEIIHLKLPKIEDLISR